MSWIPVEKALPPAGTDVLLRSIETNRRVMSGPTKGEPLDDDEIFVVGTLAPNQPGGWFSYDDNKHSWSDEPRDSETWARVTHWMAIPPQMTPAMKRRDVERKDISAWYGWLDEQPDEGSHLMILPADATDETAASFAFQLFNLQEEHAGENPFDHVIVRRAWMSRGEMITTYSMKDGSKVEMRERTTVEDDLLEELTMYLKVAEEEE